MFSLFIISSCQQKEDTPEVQVLDNTDEEGVFGDGVNLQPSYYNNGNVDLGFSLMNQQPNIKTVRIEIEPDKVSQAKTWIKQAKDNDYTVIATYHKYQHNGSDNEADLLAAANWWKANYANLRQSGQFTINLMNEWGSHSKTARDYALSYNKAISIVRQVYSGRIIIDIPGWAQETRTAADAVKGQNTGGAKINDTNIILSVHIYPSAWNQGRNRWLQNADLDELASAGRDCIVGEFGNQNSGSANWSALVDHARSKGWTLLAWAWNGDGEGYNMITPQFRAAPGNYSKSWYFSTLYNKLNTSRSCGTAPNGYPYCCSEGSDPDGDGWGWENNRSCFVRK